MAVGGVNALRRRLARPWPLAGLAALVAVVLYLPTLGLPLLYDDLLHIRITGGLNWANVWLPTEAFGFYRPLTFVPLLLVHDLFGYYPAWLLHGLNVAQHGLNAALLVLLAWRLWPRPGRALAAGLLLATFPFAYQAVAVYGHNVHPATAGLLLLGLHTYLWGLAGRRWWRVGPRFWWGATGALFLLGLLSHESAILFGPLAFLTQWAYTGRWPLPRPGAWGRLWRVPWFVFSLLGGVYLVVYQFLPLSRAPQAAAVGADFWAAWGAKLLYLLQVAAYPLTWLARFLPPTWGTAVILLGIVVLLGLVAWAARARALRPGLALGLGWWALASALIALPLPANYLLHGPRLLYLGGVGLALLWPLLLAPFGRLTRWLPPLLLLAIVLQNGLFVRGKLADYVALTGPVRAVAQVMRDRPEAEGLLLVNLPQWLAPARGTYPAGVELVSMLGDYLFVEELLAQNLGVDRPVQAVVVPELLAAPAEYRYGLHEHTAWADVRLDLAPAGSLVFIVTYAGRGEGGVQVRHTGLVRPPAAPAAPPLATLGPYALRAAGASWCDGEVQTALTLVVTDPATVAAGATLSLFVQVLGGDGQLVAQADGPPLGLRPDLLPLPPGWEMVDVRRLAPAGVPPLTLAVGVYDFATGERLPGRDALGQPLAENALLVPVVPCR